MPPHFLERTTAAVLLAWTVVMLLGSAAAALCRGDCDADGVVDRGDILHAVARALDGEPPADCGQLDADGDGRVVVEEVVAVVNVAGQPCLPTPTPSATPAPTVHQPPSLDARSVYRGFAGFPIAIPLAAVDPGEGELLYSTTSLLPEGSALDDETGVFSWTPGDEQVGAYVFSMTATDSAVPPLSSTVDLGLRVLPADACTKPVCHAANGCNYELESVAADCCEAGPLVDRVPEPVIGCPAGRAVHIGRNNISGFGRLYNCDRLRAFNSGQIGVTMRFNLELRCFDVTTGPVQIDARMETRSRLLFSRTQFANFTERGDGWAERLYLALPVSGPSPFFDLGEAEANFEITVIDRTGKSATERVRVVLQFEPLDDLPEVP